MSRELCDVTARVEREGTAATAGFEAGARVGVEQIGRVEGQLGTHSMGHGELLEAPRVGEPLALRIRGVRGLASSAVRELQAPAPGYLLVVTQASIYLVARTDCLGVPRPEAVSEAAVALVRSLEAAGSDPTGENVTQYVRLEPASAAGPVALPRGPVFASVEAAGDGASRESLGQCDLLCDVVCGAPLRLAMPDGRVIATSNVVEVATSEAGELCVATGNSVYVLAPVAAADANS